MSSTGRLRVRTRLGKYRIEAFLGEGGFARVYRAYDTIEGKSVALRVPIDHPLSSSYDAALRKEIRLVAKLDHPAILPVWNADEIGGRLVIASPIAAESLADRLTRRLAQRTCLALGDQLLDALAYAHARRVVHCDVKPENVLLKDPMHLWLSDFGLARIARKTVVASGSGTLGFMAPEQAMGRPSPRSDVFSAGLLLWRMFAGNLPDWPFTWPLTGHAVILRRYGPEMATMLRKALRVDQKQRYQDAGAMHTAYQRVLRRIASVQEAGARKGRRS